jgi:SAM-dependent methyltransferase
VNAAAPRPSLPPTGTSFWGAADAAMYEALVVPRFVRLFSEPLMELLLTTDEAQVAHIGCRTGFPDQELLTRLPNAFIFGADASEAALEIARAKKQAFRAEGGDYLVWKDGPVPMSNSAFSHVLSLLPENRERAILEAKRLLAPAGQLLLSLPLRGSYIEPIDLLREYAIKHDDHEFYRVLDAAILRLPTAETLADELSALGFEFVDVEIRRETIPFPNGEAFLEDPISRLFLRPFFNQLAAIPGKPGNLHTALTYVRRAIDRYYRDDVFELSVCIGAATARR